MRSIRTPSAVLLASALLAPALLAGCSSDDSSSGKPDTSPADVLAAAKKELDETSGVNLTLSTDALPDGVTGLLSASGVGTHAPAFEGSVKVPVAGQTFEVPITAVGGKVYAKLPLTPKYSEINPADYGAPDPADLMSTDAGLSSWLTEVESPEKGSPTREGEKVLTSYTGTLPGSAVKSVIPSADEGAEFDAVFRIDADGRLDGADVTGPFYGDKGDVDYTLQLSDYGTEKDITAP